MAYSKMSTGNTIFMSFLFVSFVIGIPDTVGKHAQLAINSPADVAHIRHFESEIYHHNPEWFSEGMGMLAYSFLGWLWKGKEVLTWAVTKKSTHLEEEVVNKIFREAFAKWEKESIFTFEEVNAHEEPDIRVEFGQPDDEGYHSMTVSDLNSDKILIATIQLEDLDIYFGAKEGSWANLSYVALLEIGHALGLGESDDREAIMGKEDRRERMRSTDDPQLSQDDKDGIKARYENAISDEKPKASRTILPQTCREYVPNFRF